MTFEKSQPKPVRCGCGGEAVVQRVKTLESHVLVVMCTKCEIATNYYTKESEAIEAWNLSMGALLPEGDPQKNDGCECSNTTERTAKVKEGWGLAMCCACEKRVFPYDNYCSHCGAKLE